MEIDLLVAALDDIRCGRTVAVFVSGEAGIGKSRLVQEFATHAKGQQGVLVLEAAAIDVDEGAPFWPVRGALRRLLRNPQNAWAVELLGPLWEELDAVLRAGVDGPASGSAHSSSTTLDLL